MAQATLEQAFQIAQRHHQAGRLAEAEQVYRQILAVNPRHADALQMLGVAAYQHGRNDIAVDLIRQALTLKPNWPEAYGNFGVVLKEQGQLDEAIAAYHQAIALKPNYPEAYSNLGIALNDQGRLDDAIAAFRRAVALQKNFPHAFYNLGNALKDKGQLDEAIAAWREAIALKPGYPEALGNLGNALKDKGQLDEAISAYRQAIVGNPSPEAYGNLGNALKDGGQLDEAIAAYRQAIALRPNFPQAYNNLGIALKEKGQLDEAIAACRRAIALKPDLPEAFSTLGAVLCERGQVEEAMAACRQAIALRPNYSEAHCTFGIALKEKGHLDDAIVAYRKAIALGPGLPEPRYNLGNALKDKGRLDEAIVAFDQAIALRPYYPEARFNRALVSLTRGNLPQGWDEYEWRWKCKGDYCPSPRNFPQPTWDGRPLAGETLLLHAEQGLGDTLQFIRYLPLVAERGGRAIVECQPELQRLLRAFAGDYHVLVKGQPLPAFDLHCPLLSLPRAFATTLEGIPRNVPYLHADPVAAEKWQERLTPGSDSLKVGLAWAGSKAHKNDRNRSLPLSALAPLARLPGVSFHSLQKGEAWAQAKDPPPGLRLSDSTEELHDFADTAGFIANLDLVISVDTAVAHLAGAMGKPVWVLLPFVPDWRWMLDRADSPWYPTMRLFRQPRVGDWESVIGHVREALKVLVS